MSYKKMSDYIKREDALKAVDGIHEDDLPRNNKIEVCDVLTLVVPSADVAPVRHGRWIEYGENKDGTHNICCSVCGGFFKSEGHANSCYTRNKYRYCPNCGARMDGEDNEID